MPLPDEYPEMKKIQADLKLSCGTHALKFEPTGDTQFAVNEIGHQKTPEIIDAYNDLFLNVLAPFRPKRMLEIGIWHGGSLALWRDVFDGCQIVGVDKSDKLLPAAAAHLTEDPRVSMEWFQCPNRRLGDLGEFDLIVYDGGHDAGIVFPTFDLLWPKLRPGGLFIIEDWKPDFCNPNEILRMLSNKIRGYWPGEDAGPEAPFKVILYRGFIAIERKR